MPTLLLTMLTTLLLTMLTLEAAAAGEKVPTVADKFEVMEEFDGGSFFMGVTHPEYENRGEHPVRQEFVRPFAIDRFPVTNRQFSEFVRATRFFRTDPELKGYSHVFFKHMTPKSKIKHKHRMLEEPWWLPITGARWYKPFGPESSWRHGMEKHPVVHVGAADADSYCKWRGKRLPNEYEWEYAARANNRSWIYPWGDHYRKGRMNTFQGLFPYEDTAFDGFDGLAPVDAFPQQNHRDMHDMMGNAWEWTSTEYYGTDKPEGRVWLILKGGSFVDSIDEGVNSIVRVSTKIGRDVDFTSENVGFRCAKTILPAPKAEKPLRVVRLSDTWEFKQAQRGTKERLQRLQQRQTVSLRAFKMDL